MKLWMIAICALMLCVGCFALSTEQEDSPSSLPEPPLSQSSSIVSAPSSSQAASQPEQAPIKAAGPILATSFGQGTDCILVREMLTDLELAFDFSPVVPAEDIGKYNTVILAIGASSKALTSSGIDPTLEFERCKQLADQLSDDSFIVLVRISDAQNQDPLTNKLLPLALPHADMILAINSGIDNTVSQYAQQNSIPLRSCEKIKDMAKLLDELLSDPA